MRFILQLNLTSQKKSGGKLFVPNWVNELLPVKNEGAIDGLSWNTFAYDSDDKSIV